MVQAPDFFTLAAQLVFRLWSRSVAVMVSVSPSASKRKFERIGMVVLRSTTDCAAVSSRSSSARETVISRLPVGTGVDAVVLVSGSSVIVLKRRLLSMALRFRGFKPDCTILGSRRYFMLNKT